MKIGIVGYGKMGKMIEKIAWDRGHEIVVKIDSNNLNDFNQKRFSSVDVAIEFTSPGSAARNINSLLEWKIPTVSGSTGWLKKMDDILASINANDGSFFYASNFSLSVNVFFEINRKLAKLMATTQDYQVSIVETHHLQKKDAPSGTAISLADQIIEQQDDKKTWKQGESDKSTTIGIESLRKEAVPGTHLIKYESERDSIEIKHIAKSRDAFAEGAVIAAEWLLGRQGYFTMQDMLEL